MTLHFRHVRKFPQKVSKEELYELTQQKLGECGVDVVAQAQFTSLMCKNVIGNNNYLFLSLQPHLKLRTDPAWRAAYTVAISFLQIYQMQISLDTIQTEAQNNKLPSHSKILQMAPEKGNALSLLREMILQSSQGSKPTFRDYVVKFSKREKLPISPSTAIPQAYKQMKSNQKTKLPTNTTYQNKPNSLMSSTTLPSDMNQQQQQWPKQQTQSFLNNNTNTTSRFLNNSSSNINNDNNFLNNSLLQKKQQPQPQPQNTLPSYSFANKQEPISQSSPIKQQSQSPTKKTNSFEAQPFSSGEGDFNIDDEEAENVPQPMISADHSYSSASSVSNTRNKQNKQDQQPQQSKFGLLSNLSQQPQTNFNNNDISQSNNQPQQQQQSKFGLLSNLSQQKQQQQQQQQQQQSDIFANNNSQLQTQTQQQPKFGLLSNLSQQQQQQKTSFLNNNSQIQNQSQNSVTASPKKQENVDQITEEEEIFESFISDVSLSSGGKNTKKSGSQSNASSPTATKKSSAGPNSKASSIKADEAEENIDDIDDFVSDIPSIGDSANSKSNSMKETNESEKDKNSQVEAENIEDDFQEEEEEEVIYDDFDIEVPESPGAPPGSPQDSNKGSQTQSIGADDFVVDDDVEDIADDFDLGT